MLFNPACPRCVPASGQSSPGMIHSISSAVNASKPCLSRRPSAARKFCTIWTFFSILIEISPSPIIQVFRSHRTFRNRSSLAKSHDDDRLLLLLEQVLEDEPTPSAAAGVHQRATLVELSQLDGCEPELFGQIRHGSDCILVVARQKDDPM